MSIAQTVQSYLADHRAPFEVVAHRHSASSLDSASEAHILPERLAKAVLLEDGRQRKHFLMAVVPATRRVRIARLSRQIGHPVRLATEKDAAGAFPDCEVGAIPALGPAYGVETVLDDSLMEQPDLYFEAGDHEHLVHMKTQALFGLLSACGRGRFSKAI